VVCGACVCSFSSLSPHRQRDLFALPPGPGGPGGGDRGVIRILRLLRLRRRAAVTAAAAAGSTDRGSTDGDGGTRERDGDGNVIEAAVSAAAADDAAADAAAANAAEAADRFSRRSRAAV
jgi:hypothetical protein